MGLESPDPGRTLFLEDSRYQRVRVLQIGNSLRSMQLDKLTHSRIDVDDPLDLRYEYEAIYAGITRVALEARPSDSSSSANSPGPPRSLFIGGGGYVFPRYLELLHPGSHNEVVELDPVVTRAAYAAMNVPADSAIVSVNLDGRNHVTDLLRRKRRGAAFEPFDFVYGDAITDRSVPFHLTTEEYLRQLAELMADDGVYLMNMMDTFESGRFLGAVVATCREVFPWVGVMARDIPADALNTFVVACSGRELDLSAVPADVEALFGFAVRTLSDAELQAAVERNPGGLVLTDDYAPVDHLLAAVVRNESRAGTEDFLAALALDDLYRAGRYDELISRCRARLAEDPRARDAHLWIGLALLAREDLDAAVVELQRAVELDPTRMRAHASLGLAHEARGEYEPAIAAYGSALALDPRDADTRTNLARALRSAGRDEASLAEYRRVVQEHPGFARARIELGRLLRDAGDAAGAAEQLEAAYALDPDRRGLREDLAAAWLALGRRAEAEALVGESPGAGGSAAIEVELGRAAAAAGRRGDATRHFARAVELEPANAGYRGNLGLALEEQGRQLEAVEQYRESLRLAPDNPPLVNALARMLAASADGRVRDGEAAVRRAEELARLVGTENPHVLDTLAAAYAEAGRFDEAIDAAERAVAIAELRERPDLADDLRARLGLYRTGRPYRVDGRWRSN
jgi:tetratricopeptide (TPR) repeat protein